MAATKLDSTAYEPGVLLAALAEWAARIDNEMQRFSLLLDEAANGSPAGDDPRVRELLDALLEGDDDA